MEEKIKAIFKKNQFWYDYDIINSGNFKVYIEWGDWKHDHAHLDYVMQQEGFHKFGERLTEENGSDCYSSVHYFSK